MECMLLFLFLDTVQPGFYYGRLFCEASFNSEVQIGEYFTSTTPPLFFCSAEYEHHSLEKNMIELLVHCIAVNDRARKQWMISDLSPSVVEKHYINNDTYYLVQIGL